MSLISIMTAKLSKTIVTIIMLTVCLAITIVIANAFVIILVATITSITTLKMFKLSRWKSFYSNCLEPSTLNPDVL